MILNRDSLQVSEIFASLQGEGLTMGRPAIFIRLGGCNLHCGSSPTAKWICDSVKLWTNAKRISFEDILRVMYLCDKDFIVPIERIVLTGGEPLMQLTGIFDFIRYMHKRLPYVDYLEIETNGTSCMSADDIKYIKKFIPNILINCSPKLSNSGIEKERRVRDSALRGWANLYKNKDIDFVFKFVVADEQDIDEVEKDFEYYIDLLGDEGFYSSKVLFMPAADNREDLQKATSRLWPTIVSRGYNLTTRLHILAFDKKVGV